VMSLRAPKLSKQPTHRQASDSAANGGARQLAVECRNLLLSAGTKALGANHRYAWGHKLTASATPVRVKGVSTAVSSACSSSLGGCQMAVHRG
jgi:hypothetical protein